VNALQTDARNQLRSLGGYRVQVDATGWPYVPGERGRLEFDGGAFCAIAGDLQTARKLQGLAGARHCPPRGRIRVIELRDDAVRPALRLIGALRPERRR
jgi:hypothetical protein